MENQKLNDERLVYTIKEMPEEDRPQEKLIKYGAENLSNAELLALIVRTGSKSDTSIGMCQKLLNHINRGGSQKSSVKSLANITIRDIKSIKGFGDSKAAMILAAIEIGKRIHNASVFERIKITSPMDTADFVMSNLRFLGVEVFQIIILNTKKEVEFVEEISKGTVDSTIVHPREVFKRAIERSAHSIILIHNHPTGDPKPSREDINLTNRLAEVGNVVGIPVLDHLIIGDSVYFSFLEEGLI